MEAILYLILISIYRFSPDSNRL